jgi:hypothetical protein
MADGGRVRVSVGVWKDAGPRRRFVFQQSWSWEQFLEELASKMGVEVSAIARVRGRAGAGAGGGAGDGGPRRRAGGGPGGGRGPR